MSAEVNNLLFSPVKVEVTCKLSPEEDGYSMAIFTPQLFDVDQNTDGEVPIYANISFTLVICKTIRK